MFVQTTGVEILLGNDSGDLSNEVWRDDRPPGGVPDILLGPTTINIVGGAVRVPVDD